MFERFTDGARRVIVLCQEAAAAPVSLVGRDLTREARAGRLGPVIARQREIGQVMQALMLEAAVPLLVGEHGAGVTAVAHGVAQAMVQPGAPRWFAGKRLVELNLDQLTAATGRTDFDNRITDLIAKIRDRPGTVWLIDNCLAPGYDQTGPAVTLLRPVLATGELLAIAATTPADCQQFSQAGDTLRSEFQGIWVNELPGHVVMEILRESRRRCEERHRVSISNDVIGTVAEFSGGPLPPGEAIELLDRAAALAVNRSPAREVELLRQRKVAAIERQEFLLAAELRQQENRLAVALPLATTGPESKPASWTIAVTTRDVAGAATAVPVRAAAASGS